MKKLISATDLRQMAEPGKPLIIPPLSILTPAAQDLARELNLEVIREKSMTQILKKTNQCEETELFDKANGSEKSQNQFDCGTIEEKVRQVLSQILKPACSNPKVSQVKGANVILEPFEQAPPGQDIKLKDVITAREANLAAGFMSFDHASFPWHLTYDEIDYVVEGTFTVETGGTVYTCAAGDVFYIPKDTKVIFGSPDQAKVFYVTYPANWAEL